MRSGERVMAELDRRVRWRAKGEIGVMSGASCHAGAVV